MIDEIVTKVSICSSNFLAVFILLLMLCAKKVINFGTRRLSSSSFPKTELYDNLKVGPMKRLYKYYTPEAINLAGGVPMDSIFPTKEVTVTLFDKKQVKVELGQNLYLNYQRGDGVPGLRDWIKSHVSTLHGANDHSATCMTIGSTDALMKIIQLIKTDAILFDEYAYGTAVTVCTTMNKKAVGIPMDAEGIDPVALRNTINELRNQNIAVHLLYLVPTGQNPTGISMSNERKQAVLDVCRDLNVKIIEDGMYIFLSVNYIQ